MAERKYHYGLGKRKTSVAKVRLYEKGKGEYTINERKFEEYFTVDMDRKDAIKPLKVTGTEKQFDLSVITRGGGVSSQADAVQLGIARALVDFDPELKSQLKKEGLMTRDSREKERKKPGLKRARRAPQWSKR